MDETPITSIAWISSRMVREPRSAQTAEPTAVASSSDATRGAPCRITTMPVAAPASEEAPTCPASRANWIDSVTLIGMVTRIVGVKAVPDMKAIWSRNSLTLNRPRKMPTKRY